MIGLGIFARLSGARRNPITPDSAIGRLLSWFSLERGLVIGGLSAAAGFAVDGRILTEWISRDFGNMAGTVHVAFVAATLMPLGVNAAHASFLFNMLREEYLK